MVLADEVRGKRVFDTDLLEGPAEELRRNTARLAAQIPYNRPLGWLALRQAEVERSVAASPG